MKKITVTFELEFGSPYQKSFFENILKSMLSVLQLHMKQSHKGNKITYEIDTHDGYKTRKY